MSPTRQVDFKNRYVSILRQYPKATFDKEIAFKNPDVEFISFGHPVFEGLLEWVKRNYFANLQKGAMFKDPAGRYNGILWFFEGEVKDGKGDVAGKRLMAIFQELGVSDQKLGIRDQELGIRRYKNQSLYEVNPAILWDFVHLDNNDSVRADISKEKAQEYAIGAVESYKQEIVEERNRQAEIKRKYGVKSLDFLIGELDAELAELYERQEEGDRVELAIRNKEERKKQYEASLKTLQLEIEQEVSLAISMPKFIGAVLVKPEYSEKVCSKEMKEIGREFVKEYEREHGREPTDVPDGYGYDLISKGKNEVRYIEIKGFSREGEADITPNEWFKAKRFKEQFWLYVVANAATSPTLYIINNPAENLNVDEKIEVVRFMVPIDEWKAKGVKA